MLALPVYRVGSADCSLTQPRCRSQPLCCRRFCGTAHLHRASWRWISATPPLVEILDAAAHASRACDRALAQLSLCVRYYLAAPRRGILGHWQRV